jgi:hypothetical protein
VVDAWPTQWPIVAHVVSNLLLVGFLLLARARFSMAGQDTPAQGTPVPVPESAPSAQDDQGPTLNAIDARRACDGCPPRRLGIGTVRNAMSLCCMGHQRLAPAGECLRRAVFLKLASIDDSENLIGGIRPERFVARVHRRSSP